MRVNTNIKSQNFQANKNYLILCNHLSYIDIFILSSLIPSVFIASIDQAKSNIILGKATQLSGSIFVERRHRSNIKEELKSISKILDLGLSLVLFPEGTTSNGERVLPFKSSFLAVAEKNGIQTLPVCIKYRKIDGRDIDYRNKDYIYYYGDMTFFRHFFKFLSVKSIDVELTLLNIIKSTENHSRKDLTLFVFQVIDAEYSE